MCSHSFRNALLEKESVRQGKMCACVSVLCVHVWVCAGFMCVFSMCVMSVWMQWKFCVYFNGVYGVCPPVNVCVSVCVGESCVPLKTLKVSARRYFHCRDWEAILGRLARACSDHRSRRCRTSSWVVFEREISTCCWVALAVMIDTNWLNVMWVKEVPFLNHFTRSYAVNTAK